MELIQKKKGLCFLMILFILLMFVIPLITFGQEGGFKPLEPLPFIRDGGNDLGSYLEGIFKFLLSISVLFAVVMVTWGGVLYITTDAIGGKSEGKKKITQAILGLLLALVSWLILNTINPDLLNFVINPEDSLPPPEETQ